MTARLHHELVARSDAQPERWMMLTHGIFGTGGNWRGIARKLVNQLPAWGVILVDLRAHGRSEVGEPPHTIEACADDLVALVRELGLPVQALAGHSFGGKVVLLARSRMKVAQTWMLDSSPSVRTFQGTTTDESNQVLALLERLPKTWASRAAFVDAIKAEGHSDMLAQWLAMNVVPAADEGGGGDEMVMRFDVVALRALFDSFCGADLWDQALDATRGRLELVIAERGGVYTDADHARLADPPPHVRVHQIAAGHWLHIQAPDAVLDMLVAGL